MRGGGQLRYVVKVTDPTKWLQVEQRPVMDLRVHFPLGLILFAGFTSITAVGTSGMPGKQNGCHGKEYALLELKLTSCMALAGM